MAFKLLFELDEEDGCSLWNVEDTSGVYNVTTNPTGYGAPNVESTAITSATFLVYQYGSTVPYTFTFTIGAGVITALTVTAPDGTVTNIFADIVNTAFPFTETLPFVINPQWLGLAADASFVSSAYRFEYNVTDGTDIYSDSVDQLITCATCCCVNNMEINLDDCSCKGSAGKKFMAKMFLDEANWAMEQEDVDKAQTILLFVQGLCTGANCNCCN